MALVLNTVSDGSSDVTMRVRLDGAEYNLRFLFNEREGRWYLTINDTDDNPILVGIKLICNEMLLDPYQSNPSVPPGEMVVVDLTGDGSPPGITDLGTTQRCQLIYLQATTLV